MNTILDAPELKLYDSNGKSRVEISAATKQPSIWLFDAEGRKRGAFATDEDSAGLQLFDPTGKVRAILVTDQNGPGLDLSGASGTRATLYVAPEGPGLSPYDFVGKRRVGMGVTADGSNVVLYDNLERSRAGLRVTSGGPVFLLLDAEGRIVWSAPNATELPRPASADRKPRVFIEARSGSWFLKPEREEDPFEERAAFVQACTQAMVTIDKQNADYSLRLEHHLAAGAVFKNPPPDYNLDFWKSSLFDVEGRQLSVQSSPTLSGTVDTVCRAIAKDWGSKSR